ncbi:MAG: hypothetical protein HDT36_04235, partial [Clostridiales bacterium]|nr:hypothetical protein [Clostridiales bacterium]
MKTKIKVVLALLCVIICGLPLVACNAGKSTLLGKPQQVAELSYSEKTSSDFVAYKIGVEKFAAAFAASAYEVYQSD